MPTDSQREVHEEGPGPPVVICFGSAYSDAVVERLASEVADAGLAARIETLTPSSGEDDTGGLIALHLTAPDLPAAAPVGEAMTSTVDALVDAARRRRRRQAAAGEVRDVAVILLLPDDVRIVVTTEAGADRTDLLMAAVGQARAAGTPAAGVWRWNPAALRLEPWRP